MNRPEGKPVLELVTLELSPTQADEIFAACKEVGLPATGEGVRDLVLGIVRGDFDEEDFEETEEDEDEPGPHNDTARGHRMGEAIGNFLADEENRKMVFGAAKATINLLRKGK